MQRIFKIITFLLLLTVCTKAQDTTNSKSVDPALLNIFNSKNPKRYTIGSIVINGNKYYDNAFMLSITGLNVGDEVVIPGGDNFSKAITNLWKQNLFSNVQIYITKVDGDAISIEIDVFERPRLSNYYFKGVKKGEIDDLKSKSGLFINRIVTENSKINAIDNIKRYFLEKSYQNIEITVEEKPDPISPSLAILTFFINKGKKVKVENVNISSTSVAEVKLKKKLGVKERGRLNFNGDKTTPIYGNKKRMTFKEYLKKGGPLSISKTKEILDPYFRFRPLSSAKFNRNKYEEGKQKLIEYYNSLGFRDMTIEKDTLSYNQEGNVNIDLKINEGRKYYFGNISFKGNTKYPDSILSLVLDIKKGDTYNLELLNKRIGKGGGPEGGADISSLYQDDGYLFFQANAVETSVYNDTIDYEIRLQEGPQATIDKVIIEGNDKTKEHVIRRELRTVPGEKFSRSDLVRSQREIINLGYFNQEKLGVNFDPHIETGTVDIKYTLEEKSSDQLELSAGWGGGIGLTGTLGVSFNNFSIKNIFKKSAWSPLPSGDGQKLSLRFQSNGRAFRSYNFSFTEPWLGGKRRNSLSLSYFNTKFSNSFNQLTNRFDFSDFSYLKSQSIGVSYGKQLKWPDDFFSIVFGINFTQYKLKEYQLFPGLSNGTSNNINFRIGLSRSSIDQPIFPRSGSNFSLNLSFTPPYSWIRSRDKYESASEAYKLVEYHKWRFTGEWYVPVGPVLGADGKQFVLKAAAKFGFLGKYSDFLDISPFERFQVGNAGLQNNFGIIGYDIVAHRGYPVYESSNPKVNAQDQTTANRFFTIFNKYTLELRYPFSTNPNSTIFGLVFFEAANGWYEFKEYNPFRLRRSAGIGMRFFLPMFGLLGFDYGIGFDRFTPDGKLRNATSFTFMLGFEPD